MGFAWELLARQNLAEGVHTAMVLDHCEKSAEGPGAPRPCCCYGRRSGNATECKFRTAPPIGMRPRGTWNEHTAEPQHAHLAPLLSGTASAAMAVVLKSMLDLPEFTNFVMSETDVQ